MTTQADMLVRSPDGKTIAAVEVKNPKDLSYDVAMELHRNMLVHGLLAQVPYFMLVSQDAGFLWKESVQKSSNSRPTLEFSMDEVVTRYLPNLSSKERLRGPELELIVLQWLIDLTTMSQAGTKEPEKSLARSGFLDLLRGATVLLEASYDSVH